MYSVRLFVRSFAREIPPLEQCLAYSSKSHPNERRVGRPRSANNSAQPAGIRTQPAGIRKQVKNHSHAGLLDDDDDNEELNMSMADQLYDAHFGETKWRHKKHGLAEYGQKYYQPPHEPPLLSWEDMTQIRQLYKSESWPFDVLARSFPANETIIQKVVKSERNLTPEEQFKHDEKVAANWILLRKGKLKISDSLRLHCLKFTNREARPISSKGRNKLNYGGVAVVYLELTKMVLTTDVAVVSQKPPRPAGSFYNLLNPHNKEEQMEAKKKEASQNDCDSSDSMSTLCRVRKRTTLEEMRKTQLEHVADRGVGASKEDKLFLYGSGPSRENMSQGSEKDNSINPKVNSENSIATKLKTTNISTSKWASAGNSKAAARQMMMAPYDEIPQRIVIPDNAKKPGALYRVEDCFYDEDGEFLYRVPGLKF